ncbi:MAG: beta-propeller fold lactonase family protein [Acidobacteriaceae bacterium]
MRRAAWAVIAGSIAMVLATGCGQNYRPVVSAINPVGPAGQPNKFAVAVSSPAPGAPGLVTVVDFAGDTVLATPSIQRDPTYFVLGSGGTAYVINAAGELDTFPAGNPAGLITSEITQTTLLAGANPVSITPVGGTGSGTVIFIPQTGSQSVAALSANGPSLLQNLSVGSNPTYVVGSDGAPRVYALSTGPGGGQAAAIETTNSLPTILNTIPVGANPVYGVMDAGRTRAYVVNQGSGNVSVINVQTNALDRTAPTIPATGTLGLNPVWAVIVPTLSELLVVNAGDGTHAGSLSVISIPLCNAVTPVTNPNCDPNNPTDTVGFGTVVATVSLGVNPVMVDALRDGSRAYVVNQGNVAAGIEGSVSVVNLQSNQVTATVAGTSSAAATASDNTSPTLVYGHPNSVSVTLASPTGKVYVTSPDNKFLTVLRTDTDAVTTHISLQGLGVRVLVTAP